jgi:hypothetical protein
VIFLYILFQVIPSEVEAAAMGALEVGKHFGSRLQPYVTESYRNVAYRVLPQARSFSNLASIRICYRQLDGEQEKRVLLFLAESGWARFITFGSVPLMANDPVKIDQTRHAVISSVLYP